MKARENVIAILRRNMQNFKVAQRLRKQLRTKTKLSQAYQKRFETQELLANLYHGLYNHCQDTAIDYFLKMKKEQEQGFESLHKKQEVNFKILFSQSRNLYKMINEQKDKLDSINKKQDGLFAISFDQVKHSEKMIIKIKDRLENFEKSFNDSVFSLTKRNPNTKDIRPSENK